MNLKAILASNQDVLSLRTQHRLEMNCQIVHDSIHTREGWCQSYALSSNGDMVGFGSIAIAGPWKDKPTVFEFYLLPEHRGQAFALFETFLKASGAQFFEVQSNDLLPTIMAMTYSQHAEAEATVFQDRLSTSLVVNGATLKCITPPEEIVTSVKRRQGGGEWLLELAGKVVGKGGILFHYNPPYGDLYMDVEEPYRHRGLGAYLVQELKHACYQLGAVPAARCNRDNVASRLTLQRAGFVPAAQILVGKISEKSKTP